MDNCQDCTLLNLVKRFPEGIKEYDLLMLLKAEQPKEAQVPLFDSLVLFQQHFLLFHALYQLDEQLHCDNAGQLIIEALNIQWLPFKDVNNNQPGYSSCEQKTDLEVGDPLRTYYLDISNLEDTSSEDVDNLLASFWISMNDESEKVNALTVLELVEPCDLTMIKKRYRQLLAVYHPDKGGCVSKTQSLNEAMSVLKRCYD